MYHGVVKEELSPFCWTQISEKKFEYQINYLKKRYTILKLSEVVHRMQNNLPLRRNTAVVTFDDGYKNNYTIAYPILKKMQIPATIFLVTGCIGKGSMCWPDILYSGIRDSREKEIDLRQFGLKQYPIRTLKEREKANEEIVQYLKSIPSDKKEVLLKEIIRRLRVEINMKSNPFELLNWEEIKVMDQEGFIEFGGHTVTHNILSQMNVHEMEREMIESCRTIEGHLGKRCPWFAYPNGRKRDFNAKAKDILKANGILCGLSTIPGLNNSMDDLFELRRISIGSNTSNARFICLISGLLFRLKSLGCVSE